MMRRRPVQEELGQASQILEVQWNAYCKENHLGNQSGNQITNEKKEQITKVR